MYDPDYRFLNMGTVGSIIELEYMRMLRSKFSKEMKNLKWYHLGEVNLNSPKVNYKLNFKPGFVICPYTKKNIEFDIAKPKILEIA